MSRLTFFWMFFWLSMAFYYEAHLVLHALSGDPFTLSNQPEGFLKFAGRVYSVGTLILWAFFPVKKVRTGAFLIFLIGFLHFVSFPYTKRFDFYPLISAIDSVICISVLWKMTKDTEIAFLNTKKGVR